MAIQLGKQTTWRYNDVHMNIHRIAIFLIVSLLLVTACASDLQSAPQPPDRSQFPTLADFWQGSAHFVVDVADSGLPMGESDTLIMADATWWSFIHASERSAGVIDQCGAPVEFPGCVVIERSSDAGTAFRLDAPVCQIACQQCPCDSKIDHVNQQQYPRVAFDGKTYYLVYEYGAFVYLRRSTDGQKWSAPQKVADTGIWNLWYAGCPAEERIGTHPNAAHSYDCLAGGPPGLYIEGNWLYIFIGLGQNPGSMGCVSGPKHMDAGTFRKCRNNPLLSAVGEYGPLDASDQRANDWFDFRTISSAEVVKVGERYYMLYEGVRGPGPGDPGDTQFGLGLARSSTERIDGAWERYAGNPILVDLPGNIGLGHADLVIADGETLLYTSLDGITRSRMKLVWK